MHIYQPYEVLADTPDTLHLIETETRQRVQFAVFRIFPITLLFAGWFIIQQSGNEIPMGFNYLLIAIILSVAVLMLSRPYITELKIATGNIFMVQKKFFSSREINTRISEIDRIILHVRRGKGGRASFKLHLKNKKNYELLRIPILWVKENNLAAISTALQQLTNITVKWV